MSTIEEYLQQWSHAPRGGPVSTFSVDRDNAVALMRRFALSDPHFYILELVQAAVANGADSIEIELYRYGDQVDLRLHWLGRGFSRLDLLNLFDYLFESDQRLEDHDVILLSRGINALLIFEPQRLLIFADDEQNGETTQISIDSALGTISPEEPDPGLRRRGGISIRVSDLRGMPDHLRFARRQPARWPEREALLERTGFDGPEISLNSTLLSSLNHHAPLLHQNTRTGRKIIEIEEADLQGRLLRDPNLTPALSLITYGVAFETLRGSDHPFPDLSGFITFNRFQKTADQYQVVRDATFDHCLARLRPYVDALRNTDSSATASSTPNRASTTSAPTSSEPSREALQENDPPALTHRVQNLAGEPLGPDDLQAIFSTATHILAIPPRPTSLKPTLSGADNYLEISSSFARSLQAERLVLAPEEIPHLRALAGPGIEILALDWDHPRDRQFTLQKPHDPPPRPWLVEELPCDPIPIQEFLDALSERYQLPRRAQELFLFQLGAHGVIRSTVYTPSHPRNQDGETHHNWVELITAERLIWNGSISLPYRGHLLQILIPAVSPAFLSSAISNIPEAPTWSRIIAETAGEWALDRLQQATNLARTTLLHTRSPLGSRAAHLAFRAWLEDALLRCQSEPDAPPSFRITSRSPTGERFRRFPFLNSLSGDSLTGDDLERLLNLNQGLLYIQRIGASPRSPQIDPSRILLVDEETELLLAEFLGITILSHPRESHRTPEELLAILKDPVQAIEHRLCFEECRRLALQYLVNQALANLPLPPSPLQDLPLFESTEGALSFQNLLLELSLGRTLLMLDGRSHATSPDRATPFEPRELPYLELSMNPSLAFLLAPLVRVESAFDYPFPDEDPTPYLLSTSVEAPFGSGTLGLIWPPPHHSAVALFDPASGHLQRLPMEESSLLGGLFQLHPDQPHLPQGELLAFIHQQEEELFRGLLHDFEPPQDEILPLLLHHVDRHLHLFSDDREEIHFDLNSPVAEEIIDYPLAIVRGFPITIRRLIRDFCINQNLRSPREWLKPHSELPRNLHTWAQTTLLPERIQRSSSIQNHSSTPSPQERPDPLVHLSRMMERLWPPLDELSAPLLRFPFMALTSQGALPDEPLLGLLAADGTLFGLLLHGEVARVFLYPDHPFVAAALGSPEVFNESHLTLLYAIYDTINALFELPDDHEMLFQERLIQGLLPEL